MSDPTILFFGTPGHPVLEGLYQHMRQRGQRRVVFVAQEKFPREVGLVMGAGADDPAGYLVPPYDEAVPLDAVRSVCLDGYIVGAERFTDVDEADVGYAQVESWATLIALFGRLSRGARVANHVTRRTLASNRAALLAHLARRGLRVPHVLVTSDPAEARRFFEVARESTMYKPVGGTQPLFKAMDASDLTRLEAIRLAPVHFEEAVAGELVRAVVVGDEVLALGAEAEPKVLPDDVMARCRSACRELDLLLGEITFQRTAGGDLIATGLLTHLSPESLEAPTVLDAAARLLEGEEDFE